MSFKYDPENSRVMHVNDEGQIAGRIVRQVELTAECIEEVAEAVVKKMARPEPQWEDMLVICDNCGHAIHVKKVDIRKPEPCEDAVSRADVKELLNRGWKNKFYPIGADVDRLPSVTQTRKMGKWIKPTGMMPPEYAGYVKCDQCGEWAPRDFKRHKQVMSSYCPNCGAQMQKEDSHE